jgi:hypothetical protein
MRLVGRFRSIMKKRLHAGRRLSERELGTRERKRGRRHSGEPFFLQKMGSPAPSQKTLKLLYVELEDVVLRADFQPNLRYRRKLSQVSVQPLNEWKYSISLGARNSIFHLFP